MARQPKSAGIKKAGRPSDFSPTIANAICERLIGGESLRKICKDDGMPDASTVCRWLAKNEDFRRQYAHAREAQADTLADEMLDIADGSEFADDNPVVVARDRLKLDARKWLASKLQPKRYGDKVTAEHVGEGGGPIVTQIQLVGPE